MNFLLINFLTVLMFQSTSNLNIHSTLLRGQFKLIFKQIKSCDLLQENNEIQHNFYLSLNPNSDTTEIRGNITLKIPLDDTFFLEENIALKDADGNWKEDMFIIKSPKACSSYRHNRHIMRAKWTTVWNGFGVMNATCPIPQGIYIAPGLDTSIFSTTNIPKTFIYGTYKIQFYYSRNNEVYGCVIYVLEIKRL